MQHEDEAAAPTQTPQEGRGFRTICGLYHQLAHVSGSMRRDTWYSRENSTPGASEQKGWDNSCFCIAKIYESVTLYQFSSVAQSCPTLCNPMDCSMPGLPVHHQTLEACSLTSIKSVILSNHFILCHPHSPPVVNLSQHQGLFQ